MCAYRLVALTTKGTLLSKQFDGQEFLKCLHQDRACLLSGKKLQIMKRIRERKRERDAGIFLIQNYTNAVFPRNDKLKLTGINISPIAARQANFSEDSGLQSLNAMVNACILN